MLTAPGMAGVMDRDQNYDTLNTAPSTGTSATLFPAEQSPVLLQPRWWP